MVKLFNQMRRERAWVAADRCFRIAEADAGGSSSQACRMIGAAAAKQDKNATATLADFFIIAHPWVKPKVTEIKITALNRAAAVLRCSVTSSRMRDERKTSWSEIK